MGNNNANLPEDKEIKIKGCCDKQSLYVSSGKVDPSDITCCICFTIFNSPRVMKCKHVFCEECISTWGKDSMATCPYCRIELKRHRGSFGRADKRTQKKIDRIALKCRNCCWQGSSCMYVTTFSVQPYLDEEQSPAESSKIILDQDSCEQGCNQQKKENPQLQGTNAKPSSQVQFEDKIVEQKKKHKAFDLFINALVYFGRNGDLEGNPLERSMFFSPEQNS